MSSPGDAAAVVLDELPNSQLTILSGGAWSAAGQFFPAAVNLALAPYLIHGLGLDRFGLFVLCTTITRFVSSFDGGLGASTGRYFAVFFGAGDDREAARLLASVAVLIAVVGAAVFAVLAFIADPVTHLFNMPDGLRPEAVFLLRTLGALVGLGILQGVLGQALQVRGRFALVQVSGSALFTVYVVGIVVSISGHHGLRGIAITMAVQQVLGVLVLLLPVLKALDFRGLTLYRRSELASFFSYAGKVQLVGLLSLFSMEIDALLIGAALSTRDVGLYAAGAGFALQLRLVPTNVLGPTQIVMARVFGLSGEGALLREFPKLQKQWVVGTTLYSVAAAASAWFAITVWLGPGFALSGSVAVILLLGNGVNLLTGTMTGLVQVVGKPGLEAGYSIVSVAINVLLTVPLIFAFGVLGVVWGTTIGAIIGSLYLLRIVHARYDASIPSFLSAVPVKATLLAGATTLALELAARPLAPAGVLGLLLCAVPALLGLLIGGACTPLGRQLFSGLRARVAKARGWKLPEARS